MHPHHRTGVLVVVVGLVVGLTVWATQGSAAIQPHAQDALRAPTSLPDALPVLGPVSGATSEDTVAQGVQDAETRQALVDALTAQQAQDLAAQLQRAAQRLLEAPAPRVEAVQAVPASPAALPDGYGCGGVNQYAAFIYYHESGCNPASVNGAGCRGIGQACPGTKLPCGDDFACQDAYFTEYAVGRYGSWEGAYQFWIGHNWW